MLYVQIALHLRQLGYIFLLSSDIQRKNNLLPPNLERVQFYILRVFILSASHILSSNIVVCLKIPLHATGLCSSFILEFFNTSSLSQRVE
jgi:hypothetical protein